MRSGRTVHVEHCMGTTFSIDIRDPGGWTGALDAVMSWLHFVDATFSTYSAASQISRINRGQLSVLDADPAVREVLDRCVDLQRATGGAFSAMYGGSLDPTGLVKGWSVDRAAALLHEHGARNFAINGGGDIVTAGAPATGHRWQVGIVDPFDRSQLFSTIGCTDIAVATSGRSERGAHIIDPFTGRPALGVASATVVASSLSTADGYATAAVSMGAAGVGWLNGLTDCEWLLVLDDRSVRASREWPGLGLRRRLQDDVDEVVPRRPCLE